METCSIPGLRSRLATVVAELADVVALIEPLTLSGSDAEDLTGLCARAERVAAAGTAMTARRAAACGAWRRAGDRNAVDWLARTTGTLRSAARTALETAERVERQPEVADAWRTGALSSVQTGHIAAAVAADPSAAGSLVGRAATDGLDNLRDRCRQITAAAAGSLGEQDAHRRIHARRGLRTWSERDGTGRIDARLTPEALAEFTAALAPYTQTVFHEARVAGTRDSHDAYRADALVHLARASTTRCSPADGADPDNANSHPPIPRTAATMIIRVDHTSLVRGHLEPSETCEIDGIGPIPVTLARHYASNAFLAAVIGISGQHDNIQDVVHLGRNVTARQHTALVARDAHCVIPGCHTRTNLEIDHVTPWALTRHTKLDDLARLCQHHHRLKTHGGWQLHGPPGHWTWHAPGTAPERPPTHPASIGPPDRVVSDAPETTLAEWPSDQTTSSDDLPLSLFSFVAPDG